MGTGQAYAGYGQVRLISPYEIHTLTDLRIEQNLNEHGQLLVRGIIPDNKQDTYIQLPVSHQTIAVQEVDDQGEPGRVLFQGLVQEVSISAIQGVYYLELSAVTYSMLMDLEPRSRSFSGEEGTYRDIVDTVLAAYDGADKLDNILNNQRPAGMVLQYKETDWAFIRRIASQFGAAVFPEVTAASPKLFLGIPEGRYWELALQPYVLHRDLAREEEIRKQTIHQEGEIDEQIYTVETEQLYKLGDKIQFLEKEFTVVGFTGQFKAGRLVYEYQFTPSEKNLQKPLYNSPLIGSSLDGTVVEVKGSEIQVHLTLDGEREVRHWLAYETPYAAEGHGGGWYSMPESGDAVRVYFPSVREESAIVTSSFRRAPLPNRASDPATKVWATPFGKEMRFQRSDITVSARQERVFLKIDDKSGLTFQSEHDLILKSHADILASVSSLRVNAGEGIYVHCKSSSMILDGETDIKAGSLQVEGLKKSPVYIEDLPPVPEVPFVDEVASEAGNTDKASGPVGILGMAQLGLQVAGMFPRVGAAATGARAGLGVAQISSIAMSVASSLPFVGGAIRAANLGRSLAASHNPFQEQIDAMQRLGFELAGAGLMGKMFMAARGVKSDMTAEEFVERLKREMNVSVSLRGDEEIPEWWFEPAKKDPIDKLVDKLIYWVTGEEPEEKTQLEQVLSAQFATMSLEQQIFATEMSNDFYAIGRGTASVDRVEEVFTPGFTPNKPKNNRNPKSPMFGKDWYEDFKIKYGKNNVEWVTNEEGKYKSVNPKNPIFGNEWYDYFRGKYGDKNVIWENDKNKPNNRFLNSPPLIQVQYGESDLSALAKNYRIENKAFDLRNLVVAEVEIDGVRTLKIVESTSRPVIKKDGTIEFKKVHSEKVLVEEKKAAELNGKTYKVYRVYTEREPCILGGHNCKELLAEEFPDAEVTYSVEYGDKASRDRGNAELAKEIEKIKE
ncbi:hypothetical protein LBW89_18395 [Paenibacillus sp. alder61]|uniref:Gp5/Type VI secretion system Vgr protein OB-fold domain-containing protein n=1 Tax=Paenibacillus faecis TaxID=862114 RepID=A0A5D0CL65_9BACL|nr:MULTISPECIES: nucleic acid/nucleotide deaminase domain-containing protein [Paenibacillus]MCA1294986.1 hypothetical protein [Paenibacillus sp. alder61]TYA10749.1 hypothetical protein FRY98_23490 [Paenibacillus faecis]